MLVVGVVYLILHFAMPGKEPSHMSYATYQSIIVRGNIPIIGSQPVQMQQQQQHPPLPPHGQKYPLPIKSLYLNTKLWMSHQALLVNMNNNNNKLFSPLHWRHHQQTKLKKRLRSLNMGSDKVYKCIQIQALLLYHYHLFFL